jgi:hypothetical protein
MDTDRPPTATRAARGSQATPSTAPEQDTAPGDDAAGAARAWEGAALRAAGQQPAPGVKVSRKKFEHVKVRAADRALR